MPLQLARVRIERDDAVAVEVVAEARAAVPVGRGVAGAEVDEVRLRVVRAAVPHAGAARLPRVAGPRLVAGLALAGDRVEAPDLPAVFRVERRDVPANAEIAAGHADDDLVLDDDGRVRDGVFLGDLLAELRGGDVPDDLARLRVDRDQMRVDRAHVERVAQNRQPAAHAAAARPRRDLRLVLERPERPAGHGVERDDLIDALHGRSLQRVEHAVHDERRRLEFLERLRLPHPLQVEVLHVGRRDLRERAEALIEQRPRVAGPVLRLLVRRAAAGRTSPAAPAPARRRRPAQRRRTAARASRVESWSGPALQRHEIAHDVGQLLRVQLVLVRRHRRLVDEPVVCAASTSRTTAAAPSSRASAP